jgi:hypothetical protein
MSYIAVEAGKTVFSLEVQFYCTVKTSVYFDSKDTVVKICVLSHGLHSLQSYQFYCQFNPATVLNQPYFREVIRKQRFHGKC